VVWPQREARRYHGEEEGADWAGRGGGVFRPCEAEERGGAAAKGGEGWQRSFLRKRRREKVENDRKWNGEEFMGWGWRYI